MVPNTSVAADSRYLSSSSVAQKLFESESAKTTGHSLEVKCSLRWKIRLLNSNKENSGSGGKVKFGRVGDSQYFIALYTPLMVHAHKFQ